jgi:outer membrane protein OmpA-like peptidoglycan-associated protein
MCSLAAPDAVCPKDAAYTLVLDELSSEETIDLGMILYDLDKYALRPEGMRELNKLVRYMSTRPELRVELSSHTDSRAPDAYNLVLSQNRAQSCVDYILAQGIEPTRIIARGYGEDRLVNGCKDGVECTDEEHQMNRRTELKIVD